MPSQNLRYLLEPLLSALGVPLGLALASIALLAAARQLRRFSERAGRIADFGRPELELARRARLLRLSRTLGYVTLFVAAAYLAGGLGLDGIRYLRLKERIYDARPSFRAAQWAEKDWRCASGQPVGAQLDRLFDNPEILVLRIKWDAFPPRYELLLSGAAALVEDVAPRRVEFTVEYVPGGKARITGMTISGDTVDSALAGTLLGRAC
jgi:hypothetical protein